MIWTVITSPSQRFTLADVCLFVCPFVVCLLFVQLLFVCCLSICLQANCYSMALTALNLTDPKYAWVIRPVEVEEVCVGGAHA